MKKLYRLIIAEVDENDDENVIFECESHYNVECLGERGVALAMLELAKDGMTDED